MVSNSNGDGPPGSIDPDTAYEIGRLGEHVRGLSKQIDRIENKLDTQYTANKKRINENENRVQTLERKWQRQQGAFAIISIVFTVVATKATGLWDSIFHGTGGGGGAS